MGNLIFLLIGVFFGAIVFLIFKKVKPAVIIGIINIIIAYLVLPVINVKFPHLIGITIINTLLVGYIFFVSYYNNNAIHNNDITTIFFSIFMVFVSCYCFIYPFLTTSDIFHSSNYRNLIKIKTSTFTADISPIDITQIRIVDQKLAVKLAEKRLGKDLALGSRVMIGKMNLQQVNGRLYWVGPLNYSGFLKWFFNEEGTPGYVMVSATNERDVRLVQEINGKKIFLKYNGNCYFGEEIHRYLYLHGYITKGLTDFTFEIDNEGNPYWVVTIYDTKVGISGKDAIGIVTVDAQTGEIKEYNINNAPKWIDRIQPEDFIKKQLNDWGEYIHGYFNFSDRDKLKPTPGMSLVYGSDGQSYWYTGMTSVGKDEATVGFVLVNTRTKEAKMYRVVGATEIAAMKSAEGAVQEKGYRATFPILYNISGVPTYFLTLKDKAGLVKLMAFVSVEDYNIIGVGSTVKEALRKYRRCLLEKGNVIAPDTVIKRLVVKGKVLRIGKDRDNYYILIKGAENKLFVCSFNLSPEIVVTRVGDFVKIEYEEGGNEVVDMVSFDNLNISLQKTRAQQVVEKRAKEVRERRFKERVEQNADAAWENLTPEQKIKLLKQLKKK